MSIYAGRFFVFSILDWLIVDAIVQFFEPANLPRRERLVHRRAVRLRKVFQTMGGASIKIGQQLSIRSDVLPYAYCTELEKLLDQGDPFPAEHARQVIEKQTGRPLSATFRGPFDFRPVGAASIACVYRAQLQDTREWVALKIRRPKIVEIYNTDLRAIYTILWGLEFTTLVRPGTYTEAFYRELSLMLLEELDFRVEARYQELFRRYYRKRKSLKVTAPEILHDLSGEEIIVSKFVSGVWVKELIQVVDSGDDRQLARLADQQIDPRRVAQRLIRGCFYGFFECPFFHGDPHPGNILVQPGNRIVMLDFGACGVFAEKERDQLRQLYAYQGEEDIGGMVQCVIRLTEPLPPIDLDAFRRELEYAWWHGFYGIKSKHAQWWERTSFRLWVALLRLVRKYRVPIPLNVLRMIRATLLYDSVAARLYARIDVFKEYRKYNRVVARKTRERIQESFLRQLLTGPDDENYLRFERLWQTFQLGVFRLNEFLREPIPNFAALQTKLTKALVLIIGWVAKVSGLVLMGLGVLVYLKWNQVRERGMDLRGLIEELFNYRDENPVFLSLVTRDGMVDYELALVASIVVSIIFIWTLLDLRRLAFKLEDIDSYREL